MPNQHDTAGLTAVIPQIRCTVAERAEAESAARECGMTLAAYVRSRIAPRPPATATVASAVERLESILIQIDDAAEDARVALDHLQDHLATPPPISSPARESAGSVAPPGRPR